MPFPAFGVQGGDMQVRALQTPEEFHRYATFSEEVYRENPYWVPPDLHHLTSLLSGEAPFGAHAHIQPFWIEEEDRILATVTTVVDDLFNRHWKEQIGHLVSFEALHAQEAAARSLLQTACQWLQERHCTAARLSYHFAWQYPFTIDAYEAVPTILHAYTPPYYHSYVKDAGFVTESGQVQYQVRFTSELAKRYQEMVECAARAGVQLRSWDFDKLTEEVALFTQKRGFSTGPSAIVSHGKIPLNFRAWALSVPSSPRSLVHAFRRAFPPQGTSGSKDSGSLDGE